MIHFDLPKEQSSILKVIGVGGGGSNAVNHMFSQGIEGVNFIICNTDAQAIAQSKVPNKVQLGPHLTQGLGAGANPQIGKQATEESLEEIRRILEVNTKMAFITAGMGGGTGTGGAPIIAKICKDLGILTVGIITTPFSYEGRKRQQQAEEGIQAMKDCVDTLLVISNDKLRHQFGNLKMKEAFAKADNVLATAAKCITDVINSTGQINVDFADVCTVMKNGGVAILGNAVASGEQRAQVAIEEALNSPLLNDNDIAGAKWILININSAEGEHEFTMDEVEIIQNYLLARAGENTDVILGLGYDNTLANEISITIIATGFEYKDPFDRKPPISPTKKEEKIVMVLDMKKEEPMVVKPMAEAASTLAPDHQTIELEITSPSPAPITMAAPIAPVLKESLQPKLVSVQMPAVQKEIIFEEVLPAVNTTALQSSFLAKPANIYAAEMNDVTATPSIEDISMTTSSNETTVQVQPAAITETPDAALEEMQLIIKESVNDNTAEVINMAAMQEHLLLLADDGQLDEVEEQKRRAAERIQKLRNLSFNVNGIEAHNEFETVPAYIRRNLELYNTVSPAENFYSSYEVKSDEKDQASISTLNTFLEGKKPD
jgi:cell division protein FtsZ